MKEFATMASLASLQGVVELDFRLLFEATPVPYLALAPDLTIVAVNDAYLRATQTAREQILGRGLFDVFPDNPNDPAATGVMNLRASLGRVLQNRMADIMPIQKYDIPTQGSTDHKFEERHWSPVNTPVFNSDGELVYIIHRVEDVTEQVLAQQVVEESEARFREIANAMPQIVWTARADGFVDWYNDWWYEYTGAQRGSNWDDAITPMHPSDVQPTWERWKESLACGEPYQMEYRFRRYSDSQYRWHLGRAVPIKDESGSVVKWIGSNTDVHDQKVIEQKLRDEQCIRERFTNALAHDLRSPLSSASTAAQILSRYPQDESRRARLLNTISESLERVDNMISDLLDANRIHARETLSLVGTECDLHSIVGNAIEDLILVHGNRVTVRAQKDVIGFWSCDGLRRVIENLVTNAFKYGSPDMPITVMLERSDDRVRLAVHNYGRALSEPEKSSLFGLFQRANSAETRGQQGWGIGLTIVKGIVESHGGRITVKSTPSEGTMFTIELPLDSRPFLSQ